MMGFLTFCQDSVFKLQVILKVKGTINQQMTCSLPVSSPPISVILLINSLVAFLCCIYLPSLCFPDFKDRGVEGFPSFFLRVEHRKLGINFLCSSLIILSMQCLCHYGSGGGRNAMISKTESVRQADEARGLGLKFAIRLQVRNYYNCA